MLFFDHLFLLRIALWRSAGKELTSWISTGEFYLYAVLIVCVRFPFGDRGWMWNSIVSVPDHCLFIYFKEIGKLSRQ